MWKICILFVLFTHYLGIGGQEEEFDDANPQARALRICSKTERYRSYDGTCNNFKNSNLGSAFTPYTRYLMASCCDGVKKFPCSKSHKPLPGAREISLLIYKDIEVIDQQWSELNVAWGQTVAHDMSLLKGYSNIVQCCKDGKYTLAQSTYPQCAAIPIPEDDPFNGPAGNECFDFTRTVALPTKPIQPITVVTHWLDISITYGSSTLDALSLRDGYGKLKSAKRNGAEWLPQSLTPSSTCTDFSFGDPCYRAGDTRVNQNTGLTYMQTLYMREHNRIAEALCGSIFCVFKDEVCYQEARRILIAIYQHITYYEYLPILYGEDYMIQKKLIYPTTTGYVNDYNPNTDPSVAVEHATAAFRNYHSAIPGEFDLYSEDLEVTRSLELSEFFNKPKIIEEEDNAEGLSRCLYAQHQYVVDQYYDEEITNKLFRNGKPLGGDLRSIDIQRSRDHCVGTYCNALRAFNISECNSFDDLRAIMPDANVDLLELLYDNVEDVELLVGISLEPNVPDTTASITNRAISTHQFYNTRTGDKYFYENGKQPAPFTVEQLNSIRTATAAMIICNSGDAVDKVTKNAFNVISDENPVVPCSEIPQVDLSLFKPNVGCFFV